MVLAIFTLMIKVRDKVDPTLLLKYVLCIYQLVWLKKAQAKIQALLDFGSKLTAMTSAYAIKLDLKVQSINVGAPKIDGFTFQIFEIVLASF